MAPAIDEKGKKTLALTLLVVFGCLAAVFATVMIVSIFKHVQPDQSLKLKDTKCFVVRSEMGGNAKCNCSHDKGKKTDGNCTAEYPCLSVIVNYTVQMNDSTDETMMTSILTDNENPEREGSEIDEEDVEARETGDSGNGTEETGRNCSIIPMCSEDFKRNNESVQRYRRQHGVVGLTFQCFYNPKTVTRVQVWHTRKSSIWSNRILTYIFSVLLVLSILSASLSFKWYKLLLLKSRIDEMNSNHIPPANTRYPTQNNVDFPPPYAERPPPENQQPSLAVPSSDAIASSPNDEI